MATRFYKNEFPEVDDLVMVKVIEVSDISSTVILLEYGDIEGIILHSELSRKKFRSINNVIRVGTKEIMQVTMIDPHKNYINLSKKNLSQDDIESGTKNYSKWSIVNSIITYVSSATENNALNLYQKYFWSFFDLYGDDFFKKVSLLNNTPLKEIIEALNSIEEQNVKDILIKTVNNRLRTSSSKYQADIEVTCYGIKGIEGIKNALQTALDEANFDTEANCASENKLFITLQASPEYLVYITSSDENFALSTLNKAISTIEKEIIKDDGKCIVKVKPRKI